MNRVLKHLLQHISWLQGMDVHTYKRTRCAHKVRLCLGRISPMVTAITRGLVLIQGVVLLAMMTRHVRVVTKTRGTVGRHVLA